jgi:predicted TIM-barrel fold metal-dependent hydrolase
LTDRDVPEPLLDTHQHLVYSDRFRYSWTESIPALGAGRFTLSDYWAEAAPATVGRSLFMETGVDDEYWQDETRFILSLASEPESRIAGVIASCRPELDPNGFDSWLDELVPTKVVGFRRILHVVPDDLSASAQFVRNVRQLGKRGKTFDMCFLQRQLPVAVALARKCDGTRLILDHCGVPDIAAGEFDGWKKEIRRLAALQHVCCKLSGVVAYCPERHPLASTIRPYIDYCVEAFGWDRLVWGSDWPVCNTTTNIGQWASIFRSMLASESADVRRAVFIGNASRIYGLADQANC